MIKRSKGAAVTTGLFVVGKCLYVFALFFASDFLHNNWSHSLLSFTFLLLFASSAIFLTLQKSWRLLADVLLFKGSQVKKEPGLINNNDRGVGGSNASHSKQLLVLFTNGLAMMASFTLFNLGLKSCGPVRAILVEFADSFLLAIPSLLCGFASIPSTRRRGLILVTIAVLLLLFSQEPGAHDSESIQQAAKGIATNTNLYVDPNASPDSPDSAAAAEGAISAGEIVAPHATRLLGVLDLSEGALGMGALLLSAALSSVRKGWEKAQSRDFGGRKRLHACSMFAGSIAIVPWILLQRFLDDTAAAVASTDEVGGAIAAAATSVPTVLEEVSTFSSILTIVFLVLFYVVLQFYAEAYATKQASDSHMLVKINLIVSFLFAALVDMWRGEERLTVPTVGAAAILFFGIHFLLQAAGKSKDGGLLSPSGSGGLIPMYTTATSKSSNASLSHGLTGFSIREIKMMFKHFMADSTSMRIFCFLSINFLFMFVELIYGWYSNSLGLISDAGHMLFDCLALAIGLYASYVSKLKPNAMYTYGYGRYEIISGYANAVFLLFIGYFIFVESVERLFTPPEITSDSLVLVSVLGLCVNMIGLFFFHDHGSHGHSHGPGGSHGHSHGPAPPVEDHGHSHGGGSSCGGGGDHGHAHGGGSKASAAEEAHRNSNMWAIYLHILADALGSVGVIISSLLVKYKGWTSADAICSIIISVMIVASVIPLIQSTLDVLNNRVPAHKEPVIRDTLHRLTTEVDGVLGYREPHFWSFSDNEIVGTIHVSVREDCEEQRMLQIITDLFRDNGIGVSNLSIQIEKEKFLSSLEQEIKLKPLLTSGHL